MADNRTIKQWNWTKMDHDNSRGIFIVVKNDFISTWNRTFVPKMYLFINDCNVFDTEKIIGF